MSSPLKIRSVDRLLFLGFCVVLLLFVHSPIALAQYRGGGSRPGNPGPPTGRRVSEEATDTIYNDEQSVPSIVDPPMVYRGGGSRPRYSGPPMGRRGGCTGDNATTLTALAPQTHVGQTTTTHPTLAWFVPTDQPMPIELQIYQYGTGTTQTLVKRVNLQSTPGIMQWTLPVDEPGLIAGQQYRWQVVLFCNSNRPSSALVAQAELQVVEEPELLRSTLASANQPLDRAQQFADAGFWYDALRETLTAPSIELTNYQFSLLNSLATLEQTSGSEQGQLQASQLNQIIHTKGQ